jgi:hypothetical protein
MAQLLGHRQTKETATDKPNLLLPRHIPTLPLWRALHSDPYAQVATMRSGRDADSASPCGSELLVRAKSAHSYVV